MISGSEVCIFPDKFSHKKQRLNCLEWTAPSVFIFNFVSQLDKVQV